MIEELKSIVGHVHDKSALNRALSKVLAMEVLRLIADSVSRIAHNWNQQIGLLRSIIGG